MTGISPLRAAAGEIVVAACLLGALALLSCAESSELEPSRNTTRLGPEAFSRVEAGRRPAVEKLGREARPVLMAPSETRLGEWHNIEVTEDRARIVDAWPGSAVSPDRTAFALYLQELPAFPATDEHWPAIARRHAREAPWQRLHEGWTLRRTRDGANLVLAVGAPAAEGEATGGAPPAGAHNLRRRLNLRLVAFEEAPLRHESRELDLPAGARLVLGYGLLPARLSDSRLPVRFRAARRCEGDRSELFSASLSTSGWREAVIYTPSFRHCRLVLETSAPGGGAPTAVWAVPRIEAPQPGDERPSLLLVSLDTLRADHVSSYGYARKTTPEIDARLAAEGTLFEDVTATYTMTDVSHMSLFTSLYPAAQPRPGRLAERDDVRLLAEILQDAGFETRAFTEDALLAGSFGFWHGFDHFVERPFSRSRRGRDTVEEALGYLHSVGGRRFFLFVHTYKTHAPYVASAPYRSLWSDGEEMAPDPRVPPRYRRLADAYDRSIREADAYVGELLDALDETGLAERTVVAVLSDHGEAFGEHGTQGHGWGPPFQEELGVPWVLRGPGVPVGQRVRGAVSLADVTPTLLDLLGLEPLPGAQGRSLTAAMQSGRAPEARPIFFGWPRKEGEGVRVGSRKLWRNADREAFYDLERDPHERAARETRWSGEAERLLGAHARKGRRRRAETAQSGRRAPEIDRDVHEALRALGYLDRTEEVGAD